jgi:opacity protein-like surface antigen
MRSKVLSIILFSMISILHGQPLIEVKAGYFFFSSAKMRKIYDRGGIDAQLSGSYPVYKDLLSVYASVEYLQKSGHSLGLRQKTEILEWPLSLGFRAEPCIADFVKWYFTAGPRYFIVRVHNDSSFVSRKMHKNGFGFFANTGLLFTIAKHFTIDLFGEYSYGRLHFHSSKPRSYGGTAQVGGLTFGGGCGYSF